MRVTPSAGYDADAQAFFTAAAITNATQKTAVNDLVVALKGYGVWANVLALYPMVGGSASSHKYNLKDPRDLDAAFRLSFVGGWTHDSNGATGDGSTGYADTFFNPYAVHGASTNVDNKHLSYYSRTAAATQCLMGKQSSVSSDRLIPSLYGNTDWSALSFHNTNNSYSPSDYKKFFLINRNNTSDFKNYVNGAEAFTTAQSALAHPNNTIYINALANTDFQVANYHSPSNCALASIGLGLSPTQVANYYTAVQAYQTALGRQV